LIDQLGPSYRYLLLDAESDGVAQIAGYVTANPGFDAIHLISHGAPGQIAIGNASLSEATLGGYTAQLSQIGSSLNTGGDLLIYGCDVAQGINGQRLITDLSQLMKLDIAASTNKTGGTGDWVLEAATGQITCLLPEIQYSADLATSPSIGWTRLIGATGSEGATAVTTGIAGSIYVAGYTKSSTLDGQSNSGGSEAFVTRLAPDGAKVWTKLTGSKDDESANALTTGFDGSIYVAGRTTSSILDGQTNSGNQDAFVTKLSADGTKVWSRLIGSKYDESADALTTGLDGSIYVAGYTASSGLEGQKISGGSDAFVTKITPDGTKVWTKVIGSGNDTRCGALTIGLDGSIYVAGYTTSSTLDGQTNSGIGDTFVTKLTSDGTKVWTKLVGSNNWDIGRALTTGLDGSIYVAGYTYSTTLDGQTNSGNDDAFITKFAPDGTKVWTKLVGSNGFDYGAALATGLDGSIYLAGGTESSTLYGQTNSGGNDVLITKFAPDGTRDWTKLVGSSGGESAFALTTGWDGAIHLAGDTSSASFQGQSNAGSLDAFAIKMLVDTTPPTIAISSNQTSYSAGQSATLTFTISEPVSDFVASDVKFSGGTLTNFAGSGTTYKATFTPTPNGPANGVISVASGKFSDAAGNFNVDGADPDNTVIVSVNTLPPVSSLVPIKTGSFGGHTYEVYSETLSWTDAQAIAKAKGGYLVSIGSDSENSYVANFKPSSLWSWIGFYQPVFTNEPVGGWVWDSGETSTYSAWAPKQPDNWQGTEHYAHIYPAPNLFIWNDLPNDNLLGFIVEYGSIVPPTITITFTTSKAKNNFNWIKKTIKSDARIQKQNWRNKIFKS
jgi:hypothetical protein